MTAAVQAASARSDLFDVVLLCHVVAAVVALGTVVATLVAAARVRAAHQGTVAAGVVRYFSPGTNWAGRSLYAVPLLGVALVAMSKGADSFDDTWVQLGFGLWVAATVLAEGILWPAERRLQAGLRDAALRASATSAAPATSAASAAPPGAAVLAASAPRPGPGSVEAASPRRPGATGPARTSAVPAVPAPVPATVRAVCTRACVAAGAATALLLAAMVIMVARP